MYSANHYIAVKRVLRPDYHKSREQQGCATRTQNQASEAFESVGVTSRTSTAAVRLQQYSKRQSVYCHFAEAVIPIVDPQWT